MNGVISTASSYHILSQSCVKKRYAELPLVHQADTTDMGKYQCPLCGGDLVPMGWFRAGDLHEMLCKCETCGTAVFR